ncbi:hypothetical protein HDU98_006157 [Podochytrium sp. JEL0797]|nr:hypothetical protein HDU98_006157 [Podochytrium sp. JEL0797]
MPEVVLDSKSSTGLAILLFFIFGMVECVAAIGFLFHFRDMPTMKRTTLAFLFPITTGSTMLCISVFFFYASPTPSTCTTRIWLQLLGFCLIIASVIPKMQMSYRLILSGQKVNKGFNTWTQILVPVIAITAGEVVLLSAWHIKTPHFVVSVTQINSSQFIITCSNGSASNAATVPLFVYNVTLLFVAIVYTLLTRDVESFTGESAFTSLIVSTFTVAGVVIVPLLLVGGTDTTASMILLQVGTTWLLASATMGCIYIPKAFTIYLADRNRKLFLKTAGRASTKLSLANPALRKASTTVEDFGISNMRGSGSSVFPSLGTRTSSGGAGKLDIKVFRKLKWGDAGKERVAVKAKSLASVLFLFLRSLLELTRQSFIFRLLGRLSVSSKT